MIPVSRRGLLAAIAAGVAGSAAARPPDTAEYVVEQGDRCLPITPLSGDETVEAFYDYRTPNTSPSGATYSSYGTTDLQRPETSICFLYDGPEGLSLVVVHDKLRDGTSGGAVTFDLNLSNPDRGAWVVGDDDYDAPTNYDTFASTETGWRVDWTWTEGRSDGGVYGLLGDDFALTIDPAFNQQAALYGDPYEGEITDWQVLSGDRSDPDRFSLALDRPVTIRPGSCDGRATTTTTRRETTAEENEDQPTGPVAPEVEILPGRVNPRSHGRLPVVVRSSEEFDATALARGTIGFGPRGERPATPAKRIRTDADGDGRRDLKLLFWMDATGIDWDTDRVRLTGETEEGRRVEAWAEVRLVPNGGDDENETEREDEAADERDEDENEEEAEDEREEEDRKETEDDEEYEEEDDEGEDRDSDHPGRGNGRGNGKGRGSGRGNGKGRGNGNGRGNGGNGRGRGRGKGNGRDD